MSAVELKSLAKVITTAWKSLALADQSEVDEVKAVLTELLESLEKITDAE